MERSTIFYGKSHYFDWAIFHSYVNLPEGIYGSYVGFYDLMVFFDGISMGFDRICRMYMGIDVGFNGI